MSITLQPPVSLLPRTRFIRASQTTQAREQGLGVVLEAISEDGIVATMLPNFPFSNFNDVTFAMWLDHNGIIDYDLVQSQMDAAGVFTTEIVARLNDPVEVKYHDVIISNFLAAMFIPHEKGYNYILMDHKAAERYVAQGLEIPLPAPNTMQARLLVEADLPQMVPGRIGQWLMMQGYRVMGMRIWDFPSNFDNPPRMTFSIMHGNDLHTSGNIAELLDELNAAEPLYAQV